MISKKFMELKDSLTEFNRILRSFTRRQQSIVGLKPIDDSELKTLLQRGYWSILFIGKDNRIITNNMASGSCPAEIGPMPNMRWNIRWGYIRNYRMRITDE